MKASFFVLLSSLARLQVLVSYALNLLYFFNSAGWCDVVEIEIASIDFLFLNNIYAANTQTLTDTAK